MATFHQKNDNQQLFLGTARGASFLLPFFCVCIAFVCVFVCVYVCMFLGVGDEIL